MPATQPNAEKYKRSETFSNRWSRKTGWHCCHSRNLGDWCLMHMHKHQSCIRRTQKLLLNNQKTANRWQFSHPPSTHTHTVSRIKTIFLLVQTRIYSSTQNQDAMKALWAQQPACGWSAVAISFSPYEHHSRWTHQKAYSLCAITISFSPYEHHSKNSITCAGTAAQGMTDQEVCIWIYKMNI